MQQAGADSRRENARPEMKKRKVSAFYTGLFGFTSILFLVLTIIFVWIFIQCITGPTDSEYDVVFVLSLLPVVVAAIGLFLSLYMVLKGAFSAAYTVDAEGMTTYWRKNTYRLLWADCVEFEIVQVPVNWSTSAAVVYCSTRVLSYFPRKKKRISSGIIRTILRTCSISSTVMRPFFRSFCIAFQSGHAIIWKRKRSCWACRGSEALSVRHIRRIPQTMVAARPVLRYNQTNLCLSA